MSDKPTLRELFLKYLTQDSATQDARRKDYNQAIFIDPSEEIGGGHQVFNGTDLDMVMEKFDRALKKWQQQLDGLTVLDEDELEAVKENYLNEDFAVRYVRDIRGHSEDTMSIAAEAQLSHTIKQLKERIG